MEEEVRDILELTKTKMREAGEFSREAYREFIEESIEYYLEKGRLSDEDDLDSMREELMSMFEEVESGEVEGLEVDEDDDDIEEESEGGEREDKVEPLEDEE
jgi:phage gp36-like protein